MEKVATLSHIDDYDEKDSIEHELNKMHDFRKHDNTEDLPEISDVFKEKTLINVSNFLMLSP